MEIKTDKRIRKINKKKSSPKSVEVPLIACLVALFMGTNYECEWFVNGVCSDDEVASSTASLSRDSRRTGTCLYTCPSSASMIWYQPNGGDALPDGHWEGNGTGMIWLCKSTKGKGEDTWIALHAIAQTLCCTMSEKAAQLLVQFYVRARGQAPLVAIQAPSFPDSYLNISAFYKKRPVSFIILLR